jgi:hypothetical protein
MERNVLDRVEIEQLFRSLQLETEEQRAAMRFEPIVIERGIPIQVITTDSTSCRTVVSKSPEVA